MAIFVWTAGDVVGLVLLCLAAVIGSIWGILWLILRIGEHFRRD